MVSTDVSKFGGFNGIQRTKFASSKLRSMPEVLAKR
jgi:hypothetical protein